MTEEQKQEEIRRNNSNAEAELQKEVACRYRRYTVGCNPQCPYFHTDECVNKPTSFTGI